MSHNQFGGKDMDLLEEKKALEAEIEALYDSIKPLEIKIKVINEKLWKIELTNFDLDKLIQ